MMSLEKIIRYFLGMGKFPYVGDHEKTWGGFAEPPTAGWKDYGPSQTTDHETTTTIIIFF